MNIREKVNEAVRAELAKRIETGVRSSQEGIVTEGVGSAIVKTLATFTGASVGSAIGSAIGYATGIGLLTIVTAAGLVSATTIGGAVAIPAIVAGTGWLAGLYKGGSFGLKMGRSVTQKDYEVYSRDLVEVTNARDELIISLVKNPNDAATQTKIDALTTKQRVIAAKLRKELDWYSKEGLISTLEYDHAVKLTGLAEQGKLTYITDKTQ